LSDNKKALAKLLIVDDDSDIVQVLKMGLLKNGFSVEAFTPHKRHYKASNLMQRAIV
jgi:DNA-binding response OmpR family regulator